MKSIYIRNLVIRFLEKKKILIVCWIIIFLLFVGLGVLKAYPEKISSSVSEELQKYEADLKEYDDAITLTQESIDMSQNLLDDLETYMNDSVLMQLDPTNVQIAAVQYMVSLPDANSDEMQKRVENISSAWNAYFSTGSLKEDISEKLGNISTNSLAEIVFLNISGNTLTFTVKHTDMEQAKNILQIIEEKVEAYQSVIQSSVGEFEMKVVDSYETTTNDSAVQNAQNSNLSNYRNYKTTLADLKTKLVTQQTTKANYIKQYAPEELITTSPKKIILIYGALGVIAGIIIPFAIYALWYTLSGKLKNKEELVAADLNVISTYNPKKGYTPSIQRGVLDLKLMVQQKKSGIICFCTLGESKWLQQVESEFRSALGEAQIDTMTIQAGSESADQLEKMAETGNCVLVTETGRTTYTQVEEQMQFCRRFNISVWGCIVIE